MASSPLLVNAPAVAVIVPVDHSKRPVGKLKVAPPAPTVRPASITTEPSPVPVNVPVYVPLDICSVAAVEALNVPPKFVPVVGMLRMPACDSTAPALLLNVTSTDEVPVP